MCYELKAIFRNKVTLVSLFLCVILGLQGLVNMERNLSSERTRELRLREYDNIIAGLKEETDRMEQSWDYYMKTLCDTEKKKTAFLNEYYYNVWLRDSYQELYDLLEASTEDEMGEFGEKCDRVILVEMLCDMNIYSWEENGYPQVEVVFAKQIEQYSELLKLEELPFQLSGLANSPFFEDEGDEQRESVTVPNYYGMKEEIERFFEALEYPNQVSEGIASPYTLLAELYSPSSVTSAIMGGILILFSAFYMTECRKNGSRQLQELRPRQKNYIVRYYYKNIMIVIMVFLICAVGFPTLMAGIRHGWGGLQTVMKVDPVNFTGWKPYEHYESYTYYNLSPIFEDYQLHGYSTNITLYPMRKIPLWLFLLYVIALSILKVIFLTLTGFIVGYFGKNQARAIFVAALVTSVYVICQFIDTGMKWNPFTIKAAWWVTTGGSNMTWLNAMVVLGMSIIVLITILFVWNRKCEYC